VYSGVFYPGPALEALSKLNLGGPPLETTHTCTLFTMPSAGPYNLHVCCANCMRLHDIATLATHGYIAAVVAALILSYLAVLNVYKYLSSFVDILQWVNSTASF